MTASLFFQALIQQTPTVSAPQVAAPQQVITHLPTQAVQPTEVAILGANGGVQEVYLIGNQLFFADNSHQGGVYETVQFEGGEQQLQQQQQPATVTFQQPQQIHPIEGTSAAGATQLRKFTASQYLFNGNNSNSFSKVLTIMRYS